MLKLHVSLYRKCRLQFHFAPWQLSAFIRILLLSCATYCIVSYCRTSYRWVSYPNTSYCIVRQSIVLCRIVRHRIVKKPQKCFTVFLKSISGILHRSLQVYKFNLTSLSLQWAFWTALTKIINSNCAAKLCANLNNFNLKWRSENTSNKSGKTGTKLQI